MSKSKRAIVPARELADRLGLIPWGINRWESRYLAVSVSAVHGSCPGSGGAKCQYAPSVLILRYYPGFTRKDAANRQKWTQGVLEMKLLCPIHARRLLRIWEVSNRGVRPT